MFEEVWAWRRLQCPGQHGRDAWLGLVVGERDMDLHGTGCLPCRTRG